MQKYYRLSLLLCLMITASCNYVPDSVIVTRGKGPDSTDTGNQPTPQTPLYTYHTVNAYLHDPNAFTQGLIFADGILYEGTGNWGQSSIRKVTLTTGEVTQKRDLSSQYFGEGITILGDRLYQLTWQSKTCFVYNKDTFEPITQFTYPTEGWGITHDGERLIMSDGSPTLYFRDPDTFAELWRLKVTDTTGPIYRLNELEYINGEIYANVWQTDRIARIDPRNGVVTGWIDLTGLLPAEDRQGRIDVLNGIAYDSENDRLFATGKWWPKLFEITLTKIN